MSARRLTRFGRAVALVGIVVMLGPILGAPGVQASTVIIQPGDDITVAEVPVLKGDTIYVAFESSGLVEFSILLPGAGTQFMIIGTSDHVRFTAPADGTYAIKFDNQDPDQTVTVDFSVTEHDTSLGAAIVVSFVILAALALGAVVIYTIMRSGGPRRP